MVLGVRGLWYGFKPFQNFLIRSIREIDQETIDRSDLEVLGILDEFAIENVPSLLCACCNAEHFAGVGYVGISKIPPDIAHEVTPGSPCIVNVDEVSLVLVHMDAVFGFFFGGIDCAAREFLHILRTTQIYELGIEIDAKIRMVVHLARLVVVGKVFLVAESTECAESDHAQGESRNGERTPRKNVLYHAGIVLRLGTTATGIGDFPENPSRFGLCLEPSDV